MFPIYFDDVLVNIPYLIILYSPPNPIDNTLQSELFEATGNIRHNRDQSGACAKFREFRAQNQNCIDISSILFCFACINYFYLISLERCPLGGDKQMDCARGLKYRIPVWLMEDFIVALCS